MECWYTRADKLPKKGQDAHNQDSSRTKRSGSAFSCFSCIKLTEIGLVLTALDLHSPWSCLDEEVSHQMFQRISWESTQEQGEGRVSGSKGKQKVLLQRTSWDTEKEYQSKPEPGICRFSHQGVTKTWFEV